MKKASTHRPASRGIRLSWHDPALRAIAYQVLVVGAVALVAWYLVANTLHNLAARNIATGFAFLDREAGFAIGESVIDYSPQDTYGRAILVGLANTLRVASIGLILATLLGTVIGIARLSTNWLLARCANAYVEFVRNIPLLLQLLIWYALISEVLPGPRNALHPLPGVFLSNRGLMIPALEGDSLTGILMAALAAIVVVAGIARRQRRIFRLTGEPRRLGVLSVAVLALLPTAGWLLTGRDIHISAPSATAFGFDGGLTLSPELFALLAGLVSYTAAFIAEIVRSGIQSVGRGQWEAAQSMGLSKARVLRLVVLPQALRVIVPPLTSQYLNVVKNSSLAVAIGYPDLVSVVNTTLNQTGQAIEGFLIVMAAYMTVSLAISVFMNWYNARIVLVER
ncbi:MULTISPECIES: ABC transporter permease subunit [unclassified Variovorax]|uniref:amino acid ABC transporter permease n=1 Tax=unclassified Variovorax TaxID=663243 RepID=UPI002576C507|nr:MULTISPECIES: ABC transporter permease subunit [unclassified Variovorax]MDM0087235.1 ABC transporter permease subunit [Variovorax sp. J22G40]MDM0144508.1 ABC transporter permease subunit [Variovorax sp. J2P1-31]